MKHYDLIVIGSGGGTKLRPAADRGYKLAIIEKSELGGTCLNRGCIPSKMLIYPSDLATHIREDAHKLHLELPSPHRRGVGGEVSIDFEKLITETNQRIGVDSDSIEPFYEKHENITLYKGHATFLEDKVIEVNGETITADKIYIATGSVPAIPNIEGLTDTPYMTSKEALKNTKLPKKMIVIGGGYIAVELGHVYGAAGCDVHFLVRSEMIKNEDKDIREVFEKDFSKRYNVHFGVSPVKVEYKNKTFYITLDSGEVMESDALFVAAGVKPMTKGLGIENTSITIDKRGYIEVDEYLETKASGVYALGDVVGNYLFRHSVNFEGEYLLREHYQTPLSNSLLQGERTRSPFPLAGERIQDRGTKRRNIIYPPVPHAIFSYPQIAGVGLTEDELITSGKEKGIDYETAIHHYKNSAMGSAMKAEVGLVKLIAEKNTGKLLGAHILGEKASDIIHMMIALISAGETVDFMTEKMIFIHPALSEVIRNAARSLKAKL